MYWIVSRSGATISRFTNDKLMIKLIDNYLIYLTCLDPFFFFNEKFSKRSDSSLLNSYRISLVHESGWIIIVLNKNKQFPFAWENNAQHFCLFSDMLRRKPETES